MNVCMMVWCYWPSPAGGAEAQCRKLSHALVLQGVTCSILTVRLRSQDRTRENDHGVRIRRLSVAQQLFDRMLVRIKTKRSVAEASAKPATPARRGSDSWISWVAHWLNCLTFMLGAFFHVLVNRSGYDVIHVHIADWMAGYGALLGRWFKIPVVCKAANMPPFPPLASWVPFRSVLDHHRRRIRFVALHHAMREALVAQGVHDGLISVIPNGVVMPAKKADAAGGAYVLCAANFSQGAKHKGFDVLLKAWRHVVSKHNHARLMMAGGGDASEWRTMAREMGVEGSVCFPGYVEDHETLYGRAMFLVLPSRHEGVSNVLLEAQAWGLPAVVSDIPGNRLVVAHERTGWVVPVDDAAALAAGIRYLLEHPRQLKAFGHEARRRVRNQFAIERTARAYVRLYHEMRDQCP